MKKQGGFIPGIRPGKPTQEYLEKVLNYLVFIGAVRTDYRRADPDLLQWCVWRIGFLRRNLHHHHCRSYS